MANVATRLPCRGEFNPPLTNPNEDPPQGIDLGDGPSPCDGQGPEHGGPEENATAGDLDVPGIVAALKAYARDLPRFLREQREGETVAYLREDFIALLPSRQDVWDLLRFRRLSDRGDLFVTQIAAADLDLCDDPHED